MANHPSALKRHRQSRKRRTANRSVRSELQTLVREVREAVAAGDKKRAQAGLRVVSVALAKAASKGRLHASNAARRTGRLHRSVAALGE